MLQYAESKKTHLICFSACDERHQYTDAGDTVDLCSMIYRPACQDTISRGATETLEKSTCQEQESGRFMEPWKVDQSPRVSL